ncbi:hypothetical protein F4861DRAFT_498539 [Xylaria intraflava]|nr:hypothetical protein F4861DRAFT_498539 [Xylaria intraflava]
MPTHGTIMNAPGMNSLPVAGIYRSTSLVINQAASLPTATLVVNDNVASPEHNNGTAFPEFGIGNTMAAAPEAVQTTLLVVNDAIAGSLAHDGARQPLSTASSPHIIEEVLNTIQNLSTVLATARSGIVNATSSGGDVITAPPSRVARMPLPTVVDSSLPKITIETIRISPANDISTPGESEVVTSVHPMPAPIPSTSEEPEVTTSEVTTPEVTTSEVTTPEVTTPEVPFAPAATTSPATAQNGP